jgi:hypothetical protein
MILKTGPCFTAELELNCPTIVGCVAALPLGPAAIAGTTQVLGKDGQYHTLPAAPVAAVPALSVSGNQLTIAGGNTVTLPDNDTQDLSISGNVISLTNGGSVTLPAGTAPTLSISGQNLTISGGNTVVLPAGADAQTLSINGQTLTIAGGNSVTLPAGVATVVTGGAGATVSGAGTSSSPYIIDVASMAGDAVFGDATISAVGQVVNTSASFTNSSTKPITGLVFSTWNASYTGAGSASGTGYNLNQSFRIDGVQDNARSSILWGGATGGFDVGMSNQGVSPSNSIGFGDSTFGPTIKKIIVAPGATVTVDVDVRLNVLAGPAVNSSFTLQSRQIAFIGIGA